MLTVLLHFALGTAGALLLFLLFTRLGGTESFSAPLGLVFVGLACGVLARYLSPWATPAVLALYAAASASERLRDRRDRRALAERERERQGGAGPG